MTSSTTGEVELRLENFEAMVKGFALQNFVMKDIVTVSQANAWIESYYRETGTELTGGLGSAVRGIPRLANFPYGEVTETKIQAYIEKYGMEGVISWEDMMLDAIPMITRTLLRISRAVAYAVDLQIYTAIEAAAGQSLAIGAGFEWDSATVSQRNPIQNIFTAKSKLKVQNFNPDVNGFIALSPTDEANLSSNSQIQQYFQWFAESDGKKYRTLAGLKLLVSNVVTTDKALIGIMKECALWKSAEGLQVFTEQHAGINVVIRAFEMGVVQIHTPNGFCTVTNTQA